MATLPVIDFSPYTASKSGEAGGAKATVAAQVHAACRDVGFFYAVGHGVSQPTQVCEASPASEALFSLSRNIPFLAPDQDPQDHIMERAREFFRLPAAAKEKINVGRSQSKARGYQFLGQNVTQVGYVRYNSTQ